MSIEYDIYLKEHKMNVQRGFTWMHMYLPNLVKDVGEWNTDFAHDASKFEDDEYKAYDAYFYGGNRSYQVVQDFNKAWLLHIHRNPHHWQHWVLINDNPDEGEIILDMPYEYIIEMICDWWSFSWKTGNLFEIFKWYEEREEHIRLSNKTRIMVYHILNQMKNKLYELYADESELAHHGIKGQKWGIKNGPPYPLKEGPSSDNIVEEAIRSGKVSKTINKDKQKRHTKSDHLPGRSYLKGDLDYAQSLVDKHSGKGEAIITNDGRWVNKERFTDSDIIGTHVDDSLNVETKTKAGTIVYSKTGTHVYPRKGEKSWD